MLFRPQSLPLALQGFAKPVAMLLRSVIENTLRHVFYFDHEVEYERSDKDAGYHMGLDDLWSYAKNHPRLVEFPGHGEFLGVLHTYYSEFSSLVHSNLQIGMTLAESLSSITFELKYIQKFSKQILDIAQSTTYLLIAFCQASDITLTPATRLLMLDIMTNRQRGLLRRE